MITPIPKKKITPLMRQLEKHRAKVAKTRDELRDTVCEYEALIDSCDRAEQALMEATGALSELA